MTIASNRLHDSCTYDRLDTSLWRSRFDAIDPVSTFYRILISQKVIYCVRLHRLEHALSIDYFPFPARLISAALSLRCPCPTVLLVFLWTGRGHGTAARDRNERVWVFFSSSVLFLPFECINTTLCLTSMRRRRAARSRCTMHTYVCAKL